MISLTGDSFSPQLFDASDAFGANQFRTERRPPTSDDVHVGALGALIENGPDGRPCGYIDSVFLHRRAEPLALDDMRNKTPIVVDVICKALFLKVPLLFRRAYGPLM